jgi:RHS repeat-associated protein
MTTPRGNVAGATASAYTTTYAYDAQNRLTSQSDPLWAAPSPALHRTAFVYDKDGNITSETTSDGNTTTSNYDAADELTSVVEPGGATTTYHYYADGTLKDRTDALGKAPTYTYNAAQEPVSVVDPLGRSTCASYDAAGNLVKNWKSGTTCSAQQLQLSTIHRDADGRPIEVTGGTSGDLFNYVNYDEDGDRTSMVDASGSWQWTYDSLGRLTSSTNGAGDQVGYKYDLDNDQTSLTYPGSKTVTRTFDSAGRMSGLTDWQTGATPYTFTYDADSNLTATTYPAASSLKQTFTYDATESKLSAAVLQGGSTEATFSSTRDSANRLSTSTAAASDPAQAYSYTASGQLSTSGPSTAQINYGYDADHQLTSIGTGSAQTFDAANELCWTIPSGAPNSPTCGTTATAPAGSTTFGYDASGERTVKTPPSGAATTYSYDDWGRLTTVGTMTGTTPGPTTATYTYDGDGRRYSKTVGTTTTRWLWDVTAPDQQILSDGNYTFVYGPDGAPLEQIDSGGTLSYLHEDQLGNVRYISSANGIVAGTAKFTPYGVKSTLGTTSPLGYRGQYTDTETGLIYLRARQYDPTNGQFLTIDPLVDLTGQPYQYTVGDPINQIDPDGTIGIDEVPEAGEVEAGEQAAAAARRVAADEADSESEATDEAERLENDESKKSDDSDECESPIGPAAEAVGPDAEAAASGLSRMDRFRALAEDGIQVGGRRFKVNAHFLNSLRKSGRRGITPEDVLDALRGEESPGTPGSTIFTNAATGTRVIVNDIDEIIGVWPSSFK